MAWSQLREAWRCRTCDTHYYHLSEIEKAKLASFAVRYQQRTGISLYARRDNGLPAPRE